MSRGGDHLTETTPEETIDDPVVEAGLESFPASDPPAWIILHAGSPARVTAHKADHEPGQTGGGTSAAGTSGARRE
jgi:hypothetical protein